MARKFSHAIAIGAIAASIAMLGTASCAHPATDRVLEPAGGPNGSPPPSPSTPATPLADGGAPVEPVVRTLEPQRDFTAIRAPELGTSR